MNPMPQSLDDIADPPEGLEAGLYVLGLLETEERDLFRQRLEADPALRAGWDTWSRRLAPMHDAIPALSPPSALWTALQRRIKGDGVDTRVSARRQTDGTWLHMLPGVTMRLLHVEPISGTRSAIMRMQPGAEIPAHDHPEVEECFVLDGTVTIDEGDYHPGDHVVALTGTSHQRIVARTATTLLLHWGAAAAV